MRGVSGLKRYALSVCAGAVIVAGCSVTPQRSSNLPDSSAAVMPRLPSYADPATLLASSTKVALWVSYKIFGNLLGLDKGGNVVVTVDAWDNGCTPPLTVKVDHEQNVWVACQFLNPPYLWGGEQEYSSSGTVKRSYAFDASRFCGSGYSRCAAQSWDGGWDNKGHVFAELSEGTWLFGSTNSRVVHNMRLGFFWWNANDPSGPATFIRASRYCKPMCGVYYMDTDRAGNIWFDFSSTGYPGLKGGLGEVTNPTTSPSVRVVFPAGTYQQPGGVYVSGHGTVLNVTDELAQLIYQYHLPVTRTSRPFNVLGPTRGAPLSGGFNKAESAMALGDLRSGIHIGNLRANLWSLYACYVPHESSPCSGAAFTPSDK
jgi:hypothetical protein